MSAGARQPSPTDVELLAAAACRYYRVAPGCVCERGGTCTAPNVWGPLAEVLVGALRTHHRLISAPDQGARP